MSFDPKLNLLSITRQVHAFLMQHAPNLSDREHWQKAKGLVQYQYGLDELAWACALSDHEVRGEAIRIQDLDWFFENHRYIHAPLSRICGYGLFYGHRFDLNAATLDPRWESEGLIDIVLAAEPHRDKKIHILDVGTGSGCLLIALLMAYPKAIGWGLDCSLQALDMARSNAERHGVLNRSFWMQSNGLDCFPQERFPIDHGDSLRFDVIVSNPPYIATDFALPDDVRFWDPALALYGGGDGLDYYRAWIDPMVHRMADKGTLALEIGWDQGAAVQKMCVRAGLIHAQIVPDLQGCDRYVWSHL